MGVVYYRIMQSLPGVVGPEWNRMETEQKYTGGVQVIEQQTANGKRQSSRSISTELIGTEMSTFLFLLLYITLALSAFVYVVVCILLHVCSLVS